MDNSLPQECQAALAALPAELQLKWQALAGSLLEMAPLGVAFSGGVDSGLLAAAAYHLLGGRMAAFTVRSPVESPGDAEAAGALAEQIGFRHVWVDVDDFQNPGFVTNPPDRCYWCKHDRFQKVGQVAARMGIHLLIEGTNADDQGDYRPGTRAVAELGLRSPLREAGFSKADVRAVAQALGLAVWDRPSAPCLATRFPYGTPVTPGGIQQVAQAEALLRELGFQPVRVRHYGDLARIEVDPAEIGRLAGLSARIVPAFKALGFLYVDADLSGYRTGSMNEVLS